MVGIAVLATVRVLWADPVTVPPRGIGVIAAHPRIVPVLPFVVPGNPDSRAVRTFPLLIVLLGRRRRLVPNVKDNGSLRVDWRGDEARYRHDSGEGQ